ncbi:hypothetical protein GCM10018793_53790 [Streptomyces sulfonofaciens]|uniref:Uncharacterized protein n=1 Tax=Streptomyces sulfonofaciens TaxID=68272 RepID=A0A919GJ93_9ACTN|nr:hypothetical protein GCM10018793_53790 [Streptomyces sulfonofaciens]
MPIIITAGAPKAPELPVPALSFGGGRTRRGPDVPERVRFVLFPAPDGFDADLHIGVTDFAHGAPGLLRGFGEIWTTAGPWLFCGVFAGDGGRRVGGSAGRRVGGSAGRRVGGEPSTGGGSRDRGGRRGPVAGDAHLRREAGTGGRRGGPGRELAVALPPVPVAAAVAYAAGGVFKSPVADGKCPCRTVTGPGVALS